MAYRAVQKGDRISEYTLVEKLGEGGFGEVWKAEHAQIPGKFVAIKIPTSPERMDCLKQEAVFQHELDHPNIVKTIGLNTQNDPPYFMMEFVDGKNLRQLMVEDGILPPPYAIDIAVQVCEALAFAHGKNVVHKDVKPENILVEKKRVDVSNRGKALLHYVKLTDLGLGMFPGRGQSEIVISQNARTSGVRIMSGTLFYMAPEQMMPGRQVDSRADIYSLGVVLYEMLTGELPLGMDLPSELNPVVPAELDAICKRALSIDRDARYPDMKALAADLQKAKDAFLVKLVASGAPALEVTPQGGLRRFTPQGTPLAAGAEPPRKRRWLPAVEWALLAFVLALLGVSACAFVSLNRSLEKAKTAPPPPAAAALLEGPLRVDSQPREAEVWFDGRREGVAPVQISNVTFEKHALRLTRPFHAPRELVLEPRMVEGRRAFRVLDRATNAPLAVLDCGAGCTLGGVELRRLKGRVHITTPRVEKADVFIGEGPEPEFYGPTPFEGELDAGVHRFRLRKEGYKEFSFWERVEGDATLTKEVALLESGRAEPPASQPASHRVQLASTPEGATVYVNEAERGVTPCELDLPAGDYELRLVKKYHDPRVATLSVNSSVTRAYALARVRQSVTFHSEPPGARVFVDGVQVGVTPVSAEAIEGGSHKASFVLDGHYDQTAAFEVLNRDPLEKPIKATLQKIPPARLSIECEVNGVEAWVDGQPAGRLPLAPRSVEAGKHRVRVLGVERTVAAEPGVELKLAFTRKDLDLAFVPAGEFQYGTATPNAGEEFNRKERTGAYFIDKTEVTNEQYALFLEHLARTNDHARCHPDEKRGDPRNHEPAFWKNAHFNTPRQPVVGVTWYDAWAYAAWAGKRLPTEKEWERAARGNTRWMYPWGNDWLEGAEKRCNWGDFKGAVDGFEHTSPVGAFKGESPVGCFDMVGNVSEWCVDDFPNRAPNKVIRGGSFRLKDWVTTVSRWEERPGATLQDVGFRCVVDQKP